MASTTTIPAKRILPAKENALFKSLLQLYETRQYKKALKVADQILKKAPEHGETTSMKGLVLTNLNRREEGIQLVKNGVLLDISSHICWHVYGIVHKADRNYDEALKCYLRALKFDKDNINILRDTAQLQLQLRQYDSLQDTRLALLRLRPNVRLGWIGLSVAYHLNGKPHEARRVLDHYLTTLKGVPEHDFEFSELLLYYVALIEELGDYVEALQQYLRARGIELEGLSEKTNTDAVQLLRGISADVPQASTPTRMALAISSGDEFVALAEQYLLAGLTRGIPSIFADLNSLYSDPTKRNQLGQIVETFLTHALEPTADHDPSAYVWTLCYLARHHSHVSAFDPTTALRFIDIAISHTPTLPELYMVKARILKRSGDSIGAAEAMEEARCLDLQDRYLNTKCAKYLLRDGQIDAASAILGLFTKKDAPSPGSDLEEMQSLLYMLEEGRAYERLGKVNMALKRYRGVEKIFNDFEDDQFDFHSYCLRRHTLTAYESLLAFEDKLRSHPAYAFAAFSAARIYIRLFDNPTLASSSTPEGHKKPKRKPKKTEKKPPANPPEAPEDREQPPPPKDDDPDGTKLLAVQDPLNEAAKLIRPLKELRSEDINVWLLTFDISIQKYLQAAQALFSARAIDSKHPELHHRIIEFHSGLSPSPLEPVQTVLTQLQATVIPAQVSLERYNSDYLQAHPESAEALLSHCRALYKIRGVGAKCDIEELIMGLARPDLTVPLTVALQVEEFLQHTLRSQRLSDFRHEMDQRFPFSSTFKSEEEKAMLRKSRLPSVPVDDEYQPI
ncbi:hypothetical protein FRB99_006229 [Tulasnella sp. 403]|nr:hypothetical protein FRB99_006229 [Tulasnella sp. 403]